MLTQHYPNLDDDLCQLLETMELNDTKRKVNIVPQIRSNLEDEMEGDRALKPVMMLERLSSEEALKQGEMPSGCAYLRSIRHQLEWGSHSTTGGEYLDVIFTHREILFSQPVLHEDCARSFSDLAGMLEKRAWRSDRDADPEAVTAYRHEACVLASLF